MRFHPGLVNATLVLYMVDYLICMEYVTIRNKALKLWNSVTLLHNLHDPSITLTSERERSLPHPVSYVHDDVLISALIGWIEPGMSQLLPCTAMICVLMI